MPHTYESAPVQVERFYTGVISQRNRLAIPIRVMGRRLIELYDAILSGTNAELTVRATLQRACGYITYNTNTVSGVPQKFYAFQPTSQPGTILQMIDTTTGVFYVQPGTKVPTTLITKTQAKQSSFYGVGNYLYIGNNEFSNKWDGGTQGITKWGIAIGSINNATGPNGTGTGSDVVFAGGTAWANPGNITANDGVFSTVTVPASSGTSLSSGPLPPGTGGQSAGTGSDGNIWANTANIVAQDGIAATYPVSAGATTNDLQATNFGFSIPPTATITGITAQIKRKRAGAGAFLIDNDITLLKGGVPVGANRSIAANWPLFFSFITAGSASDLWGTTWTPADINSSGFGVQISTTEGSGVNPSTAFVDFFQITVTYTTPAGTPLYSDYLEGTNFGFALAAGSTVSGILVEVKGLQPVGNNALSTLTFTLLKAGNLIGVSKTNINLPAANGFVSAGGQSDLWGTTWTINDVNQATFGLAIQASNTGATSASWSVDFVRITIFGVGGPTVVLVAGTLTATQGFQYLFTYGNSNDGNISNPTPASSSIKPVAQGVQISLTASTDPQVNQIRVFRTTDTGTGAVFFELPTSPYPNTTTTVVDNAPDNTLQVTQAVIVGSLAFSPPPQGLVNIEWYAGRLWGSVGNLLYFSAGPDNFPMGKGTSNWPPANVFELPTQIVKSIALNGGNGMLVVTLDGIHVVQGISNPGFTVNKWLSDVGARQQNAVDTDGSNIYIFTSDRQFLHISAAGIEELSQQISDQTDLLDPTSVYVCQHRSGSQDSRVFLTDGSTTLFPYNLMMGAWEPAKRPVDGGGVGAIGSIEINPGVFKFLKGGTSGNQLVLQRDQNTFSDNGVSYSWNVVFGNIPLTDPTQLANLESLVIRMTNAGSIPVVGVLPNDISGSFITLPYSKDEPPEGNVPATGHQAKKFYFTTGDLWTQMSHLQIQFSFGAEPVQNEILSWGLFPNQSTDQQVGKIPEIQGR